MTATLQSRSFAQLSADLAKPGGNIALDLGNNPAACHWLHMAVGISGEAGELLDAVKKAVIYQRPLDRENVVEELGDLRFYMAGLMNALNISEMELLYATNAKLARRYPQGGYSDAQAQARADKDEG